MVVGVDGVGYADCDAVTDGYDVEDDKRYVGVATEFASSHPDDNCGEMQLVE